MYFIFTGSRPPYYLMTIAFINSTSVISFHLYDFFLPPDLPWIYHVLHLNDTCCYFSVFVFHSLCVCREPHLSRECKCHQENWEALLNLTVVRKRIPSSFCTFFLAFTIFFFCSWSCPRLQENIAALSHNRCEWDQNSKIHSDEYSWKWWLWCILVFACLFYYEWENKRKINVNQMWMFIGEIICYRPWMLSGCLPGIIDLHTHQNKSSKIPWFWHRPTEYSVFIWVHVHEFPVTLVQW